MYIPIILGTARSGRQSVKVARYMLKQVKAAGLQTELLDVRNYRLPATDRTLKSAVAKKYSQKIKKAAGLIVVSPEYNHGYPGELKMMLDMLYEEYFYKPIGICGVSSSYLGGARMVEQLRQVFVELHMFNSREALYFPNVQDLFDNAGKIKDSSYAQRVKVFINELLKLVKH